MYFPVKKLTVSKSGNPYKMGIFLTIMLRIFLSYIVFNYTQEIGNWVVIF